AATAENNWVETLMLLLWIAVPNLILLFLAVKNIWQSRSVSLVSALMLMCGGFVLTIPAVTWVDPVAAYRVAMPTLIGGLLFLGNYHQRMMRYFAVLWLTGLCILLLLPQLWIG